MDTPEFVNPRRSKEVNEMVVHRADLPLHCPTDENAMSYSHPKVYLSIEDSEDKTSRCPYCGTLYRLLD